MSDPVRYAPARRRARSVTYGLSVGVARVAAILLMCFILFVIPLLNAFHLDWVTDPLPGDRDRRPAIYAQAQTAARVAQWLWYAAALASIVTAILLLALPFGAAMSEGRRIRLGVSALIVTGALTLACLWVGGYAVLLVG